MLFLIVVILFRFESVQTSTAQWLTDYVNEEYDADIAVEKLHITYAGDVRLENALALDHRKDTVIAIGNLETSIISFGELMNGQPDLGDVQLDNVLFNMVRYKEDARDNLSMFLAKFRSGKSTASKPFELNTGELEITNSTVRVIDEHLRYPESFIANDLNLTATTFSIVGSKISAPITHGDFQMLMGVMKEVDGVRGLTISDFSTDFSYDSDQLVAHDLYIKTPKSEIKGDLTLNYELADFKNFNNKVQWDVNFDEASLSTTEFRTFYPEFTPNATVDLKGHMTGVLNDFTVDNMKARTLNNIDINGDVRFVNVVDHIDQFFIEGTFSKAQASTADLKRFLPRVLGNKIPKEVDDLGVITINGYANVNATTLNADVMGTTKKGAFKTDIALTDIQSSAPAYDGTIQVSNIDLGMLTGESSLGLATLNMKISGRGFNPDNLNTNITGGVIQIDYNGYTYKNIKIDGRLQKPLFDGRASINDPNLKMTFNGLADLSEDINKYDFKASVDYADLKAINLFTRDSTAILKGDVIMKMKGTNLNDAFGFIDFKNTSYQNENDTYEFEDFMVESTFDQQVRTITVNSPDIIEGEISGVFNVEEIPELFKNAIGNVYTNYRSTTITKDQYLAYEFQIYDKIVDLFFPDIALGENTILKGEVASNEAEFKMIFRTPEIKMFDDITLDKVNVQVNNQNPIFNTYIKIDNVKNGVYDLDEFKLINVTRKDTLFFRTEFVSDKRKTDKYNLSFYHTVNDSSQSVVGIRKSDIKFEGNKWLVNQQNDNVQFVFDHDFKDFSLDQLKLQHNAEEITVAGTINGSSNKDLHLDFKDVRIASLTSPIDSLKMRGLINGGFDLKQSNGRYEPSSDVSINGFEVNDTPLGDFDLQIKGNNDLTRYNVNAQLQGDDQKTLNATGFIDTSQKFSTIDVDLNLNDFNLVALSPLGGIVLDNMRGLASGDVAITGKLVEPQLDGAVTLNGAGLNIPYLNTDFNLEENASIGVRTNIFDFNTIEMTDTKYGTQGILSGDIRHKNFGFWEIGLDLESDKLLVLDTELTPESLYYGTAFIDGSASITGPTDQLYIEVDATTKKGTVFKVPLNDAESLADASVIYFLSPEEKEARISGEEIEIDDISGLELKFDLNITPDAEVEITVDQENGSFLTGNGYGKLRLEINTLGKFNMYGDFLVADGVYNFKYAGIVNKEFNIQPGGSVAWQGDPLEAVIDVSASYKTLANPAILLDNPNINTDIPVEVLTKLEGSLSYFDPDFEIIFPNANSVVTSELQYRLEDKSQRYLQAMSLITAGTFYNPNSILQNAGAGNLVESLSSIVNQIVGGNNGDIKFGVNYEAADRNPNADFIRADRFAVDVSTQISERVLINGRLGVPVGTTSATERAVIGNVEVEFLLNEDGSLRLKIFNREDNLQQIGQQEGYAQGVGLSYSVDFDTMKELYRKIFKKKITTEKKVPSSQILDNTMPVKFD